MTLTAEGMLVKTRYQGAIAQLYGRIAPLYDVFTDYEWVHHRRALEWARVKPGSTVLEVACGTGRATVMLAEALGEHSILHALDLTPEMLARARVKLERRGLLGRVKLQTGDARKLPFPDESFELVYNGYMFDLLDADEFMPFVREFYRVLKPGGRLVLTNMSKNTSDVTLYEKLYQRGWLGITSGACRPVLMKLSVEAAGFTHVQRDYFTNRSWFPLNYLIGTEIVIADKPIH